MSNKINVWGKAFELDRKDVTEFCNYVLKCRSTNEFKISNLFDLGRDRFLVIIQEYSDTVPHAFFEERIEKYFSDKQEQKKILEQDKLSKKPVIGAHVRITLFNSSFMNDFGVISKIHENEAYPSFEIMFPGPKGFHHAKANFKASEFEVI